jgi:hypothetical protein
MLDSGSPESRRTVYVRLICEALQHFGKGIRILGVAFDRPKLRQLIADEALRPHSSNWA